MINMLKIIFIIFFIIVGVNLFIGITDSNNITQDSILSGLNQIREQNKLSDLSIDPKLNEIAMAKAQALCKAKVLTHDIGSKKWKSWFPKDDKSYGENLSWHYTDTQTLMNAWINSSTHRANIVEPDFKYTGIAILDCDNTYYVVNNFSD